jgi:transposase-like protein
VEEINMTNKGNRYNKEFRADIIRLVIDEHKSVNKVAQDYGINAQTIRNWVKEAEVKKDPVNSRVAELEAQLREERKKSSDLEQTVNILKKSVAIFIQDNRK